MNGTLVREAHHFPGPPERESDIADHGAAQPRRSRKAVLVGLMSAAGFISGIIGGTSFVGPDEIRTGVEVPVYYPKVVEVTVDARGRTRGERVVEAVLEAAPQCIPRIEIGRAPIEERKSFMMATRHRVHGAEARSGLLNIEAKVERFGGWLYGVVYAEGCTP